MILYYRLIYLVIGLLCSLSAYALINNPNDPTQCHPLGDCKTMCEQHQGNNEADFAIPGKQCICPACNTLNSGQ